MSNKFVSQSAKQTEKTANNVAQNVNPPAQSSTDQKAKAAADSKARDARLTN